MVDANNKSGVVAQLDEHKPSKFADAGSNPVGLKKHVCNFPTPQAKEDGWVCKTCNAAFRTKHELDEHRKISGEAKARSKSKVCPLCGISFSNKRDHNKVCSKKAHGPHRWTDEEKRHLSDIALKNTYRRMMRHTQEYHGILYDSSWEVEMAKRLEFLNEQFERPKNPISYTSVDGKQHNYFPDFWVPRIQKFIEVKNPYLFNNDSKVQILKAERSDIIWLTSLEQIQSFTL